MFAAALSLTGLVLMTGCDDRPYPQAASNYAEPPKSAPPPSLDGAPVPPPQTVAPEPPPAVGPPPPRPYNPPDIVAMAPIPNPGDPGSESYYPSRAGGRRVHARLYTSPQVKHDEDASATPEPLRPKANAPRSSSPAPTGPSAQAETPVQKGAALTASAPPADAKDHASSLAALQSALSDAVSKGAVFSAPTVFVANTPAEVTLTLPASFADTLNSEARKNGLSDASASVNLTALLSGAGFVIVPGEVQAQPLVLGKQTEFRWTITSQPGAKGPLHADVGADLLGAGSETLALGSLQSQTGSGVTPTPRLIGLVILILILGLVGAWLFRGRGTGSSALARRASTEARPAPPLDMGAGES